MKKLLLVIGIAFFTFAASGLFAHFYSRTDNFSLRYVLWKKGLYPYPSDIISGALYADNERNEIVRGKTKEEIRAMFPDASETLDWYQNIYKRDLDGRDYLWIGKYGVIIFFKNGLGDEVSIMKG